MPFVLPEYDEVFAGFVGDTVRELARAREPLLSGVQFVPMATTAGSTYRTREGTDLDLPPRLTQFQLSMSEELIRDTDVAAFVDQMDQAAEDYARQLVGHMLATTSAITQATGNVLDAAGEPLSFEHIYQLLDRMEFGLDEEDQLVMPSLVMHPDTAARLEQPTAEQRARLNALKERKLREALARRRRRRLS
jgi:hypothetical protein